MKVAVGADHRGTEILSQLILQLEQDGWSVLAKGQAQQRSCDYPDIAWPVARAVSDAEAARGILVCGSGIGMCIAANKVPGVRAALVHDELGAEISRRHNDANVCCLAADLLGQRIIERIVTTWLTTEFEGGRHARRNRKIQAIEAGQNPESVTEEGASVSE
jgi:ribose 5-phosphate isomerase B